MGTERGQVERSQTTATSQDPAAVEGANVGTPVPARLQSQEIIAATPEGPGTAQADPRAAPPQGDGAQGTQPQGTQATQPQGTQATQPQGTQATQPQATQATQPQATQATQPQATQATPPQGPQAAADETAPHLQRLPLPTLSNPRAPGLVEPEAPVVAPTPVATRPGRRPPPAPVDPHTRTANYRAAPENFSGIAEVQAFVRALANRQATALTSQGAATTRQARAELQDARGDQAEQAAMTEAGFSSRPRPHPTREESQRRAAAQREGRQRRRAAEDAVPTDPAELRTAIEAQAREELQARWTSAIRGRLGREAATANIHRFAQFWMSEEQERVLVLIDRQRDGRARLRGYTRYLEPGAPLLAQIEADSRARHQGPGVVWQEADATRPYTRYTETRQTVDREGNPVERRHLYGFGESLPLHPSARGGGRVAEYTNQVVPAIRAAWDGPWRADSYTGHGGGAWQGAGLCLDFYVNETRRDARGFFEVEGVMQLLTAIQTASQQLGGDWQGCYDDHRILHWVRETFGGNKVVYVNDARANNHGPLLLHVHIDLLPPGQSGRPPRPGPAASEVRRP